MSAPSARPQAAPTTTTTTAARPQTADEHVQKGRPVLEELLERKYTYVPFQEADEIELSAQLVIDLLCVPTKNGYRCDKKTAIKFMMMCRAKRLNPYAGDAFLTGYESDEKTSDGKTKITWQLITAHQALMKRAESNAQYDGMESGCIVKPKDVDALVDRVGDFMLPGDTLLGGWAVVYRKDRKHPSRARLNFSVFNTGRARWKKDPAGMMVKCAEADAQRLAFPCELGGMITEAEVPRSLNMEAAQAVEPEVSGESNGQYQPDGVQAPQLDE